MGFLFGLVIWILPAHIYFSRSDRVRLSTFVEKHPPKRFLAYFLLRLMPIWFFIWIGIGGYTAPTGSVDIDPQSLLSLSAKSYLFAFLLWGGPTFIESLLEIKTRVAAFHYIAGGRFRSAPKYVVYQPKVYQFGLIRLLLVFLFGVVPLPFL